MMAKSFAASVDTWVRATKERMDAVVRGSTQDVIAEAQRPVSKGGNLPIRTGFLRASLQSSLVGSTSLTGPESYTLVAGQMEAGDLAVFGWTANYARHVEYGARGVPGRHFVGNAVLQWQQIVANNVAKAKAAVNV